MSDIGNREVIPRSEYEYPQEVRAEAVALALAYGSYADAARQMAKRYPERSPSGDLIRVWTKNQEPEHFEALSRERNEQLYERSLALALLTVGKLEEEVEEGSITGKTLAITYGISTDKVIKIHELVQRSRESDGSRALADAMERMKDFTRSQLDDVIEGKLITPDDAPDGADGD